MFSIVSVLEPLLTGRVVLILSSILLTWLLCLRLLKGQKPMSIAWFKAATYGYPFWLLKEVMISAWDVTRCIWGPSSRIAPAWSTLPHRQNNDLGRTLYALSITLTPGTITVAINDNDVLVHALTTASLEGVKSGEMDQKVAQLTKAEEK